MKSKVAWNKVQRQKEGALLGKGKPVLTLIPKLFIVCYVI